MKKYINRFLSFLYLIVVPQFVRAQSFDSVMRSSGRIYVVIAVLVVILVGIFMYLYRIEKKLKKLEHDNKD